MDKDLSERWQKNEMPFNQMVLYPQNWLSLAQLSLAIRVIVDQINQFMPNMQLLYFLDWHNHDAWITGTTPATWETILQYSTYLLTPNAIEGCQGDDDLVYQAYYPENFSFLLRADTDWHVSDSIFPWKRKLDAYGTFDFTASPDLISPLHIKLESQTRLKFTIEPAKPYFDRRYAG
jgi:hypothetical protein